MKYIFNSSRSFNRIKWSFLLLVTCLTLLYNPLYSQGLPAGFSQVPASQQITLDTNRYNKLVKALANNDKSGHWPVKTPYPLNGALLPFNRIVAFYGNLYSKRMGILGELPKDSMLAKLLSETEKWRKADSSIPVIPALHYIAVTAQGAAGKDGKYRNRMPASQIDKIIGMAEKIKGIVFLDIQTAHSTVEAELPHLKSYLLMPNVHLGIDPEFSMKNGAVPGSSIGTFDAADINVAINFLAQIVKEYHLPPKVLIVHRFTRNMITNYKQIKKVPEVQVVIDMDGFGSKVLKKATYKSYIYPEPVQFTGFKLFYKNDKNKGLPNMFTPEELLHFTPVPIYIQYQ